MFGSLPTRSPATKERRTPTEKNSLHRRGHLEDEFYPGQADDKRYRQLPRPDHLVPKTPNGIGHFTMRSYPSFTSYSDRSLWRRGQRYGRHQCTTPNPTCGYVLLLFIIILLLLFIPISPLSSTSARWTTRTRTASSTSTAARPRPRSSENLWFVSFFAFFSAFFWPYPHTTHMLLPRLANHKDPVWNQEFSLYVHTSVRCVAFGRVRACLRARSRLTLYSSSVGLGR